MGLSYVNTGDVNQGIDVIPSIMEFKGIYGITSIILAFIRHAPLSCACRINAKMLDLIKNGKYY